MINAKDIFNDRASFSQSKLEEVRANIQKLEELNRTTDLTIFGAGSFARHEASIYSDIDMFFLCSQDRREQSEPRTRELRLFGRMIELVENLNFPKFSNDCQYLSILSINDILQHLGSPTDDHQNYFTARMLLLLESKWLYGEEIYKEIIAAIVHSYFVDYPKHAPEFQPTFLLNDICRYWKTLLLNYENKRNRTEISDLQKANQRVRNFKLKFSRMTTCFATIAALGSFNSSVTEEEVIELVHLTPRERLETISARVPAVAEEIENILKDYAWFLQMTALSTEELRQKFEKKEDRASMFARANEYGHSMFALIQKLDASGRNNLMRYLVI